MATLTPEQQVVYNERKKIIRRRILDQWKTFALISDDPELHYTPTTGDRSGQRLSIAESIRNWILMPARMFASDNTLILNDRLWTQVLSETQKSPLDLIERVTPKNWADNKDQFARCYCVQGGNSFSRSQIHTRTFTSTPVDTWKWLGFVGLKSAGI